METTEIYNRCESNSTLATATNDELTSALAGATRDIYRFAIKREIVYRSRKHESSRTDGMTKNRYAASMNRVPTKRELR